MQWLVIVAGMAPQVFADYTNALHWAKAQGDATIWQLPLVFTPTAVVPHYGLAFVCKVGG